MMFVLIGILFLSVSSVFAETIVLKSGETVEGKLIEKTDKYIKIDFQGVPLTYFFDEVKSIDGAKLIPPSLVPQSEKQASWILKEDGLLCSGSCNDLIKEINSSYFSYRSLGIKGIELEIQDDKFSKGINNRFGDAPIRLKLLFSCTDPPFLRSVKSLSSPDLDQTEESRGLESVIISWGQIVIRYIFMGNLIIDQPDYYKSISFKKEGRKLIFNGGEGGAGYMNEMVFDEKNTLISFSSDLPGNSKNQIINFRKQSGGYLMSSYEMWEGRTNVVKMEFKFENIESVPFPVETKIISESGYTDKIYCDNIKFIK